MNTSTVNNRTRQSIVAAATTAAAAAAAGAKGELGSEAAVVAAKVEEEQDPLLLPERFGRLNSIFRSQNTTQQQQHHHNHEDVTDTDITETEEHPDDATTTATTTATTNDSIVRRRPAAIKQASSYGEEHEKVFPQEMADQVAATTVATTTAAAAAPLLPLTELIERLAQVNHQDENEVAAAAATTVSSTSLSSKLTQRLDRTQHEASCRRSTQTSSTSNNNNTSLLSMEEMTRILTHINLCEASNNTQPQWDLVHDHLVEACDCEHHHHCHYELQDNNEKWDDSSILGSYDGSVLHSFDEEAEAAEESTSVPSFYCTSADGGPLSEASLSIHKLMFQRDQDDDDDDHDDASGITIDALSQSCSSSVTWYEGNDYEEVEVSSEEEAELKEILYAEALSSYAESSTSSSCSRAQSGGDNSYTEEIVESVDGSADNSSYTEVSVETSQSI